MRKFEWSVNDKNGESVFSGDVIIENHEHNLYVLIIQKIEKENEIVLSSHYGLTIKEV